MLLRTKGIPHLIREPIVATVTKNLLSSGADRVIVTDNDSAIPNGLPFKAILSTKDIATGHTDTPSVSSIPTTDHLAEGDIVVINPDGRVNTLYRINSDHNFILVTERCNSNCLMCSQPPRDRNDIPYLFHIYKQLIPLIPKDCYELGITGGEPTLMGDTFFELLHLFKTELPETEIHCLSNGRAFAWSKMAERLGAMNYNRLMLGIPLYSDYYPVHDYIVQAQHAFDQTMQGLYNLALSEQRIELRIVLHKLSIPRLTRLAAYICKNLPFVEQIVFMGLEHEGYTPHNIEKLWIDPVEYMSELAEAVELISLMGMNVFIYNLPLCLLPPSLWKFSKKSISDWKNIYLDECSKCSMIAECGGLFASGQHKHSEFIKAFL